VGETRRRLWTDLGKIKAELLNGRDLSKKGDHKRQVEYVTRTAEKALRGL
jgi:hypothetical protein